MSLKSCSRGDTACRGCAEAAGCGGSRAEAGREGGDREIGAARRSTGALGRRQQLQHQAGGLVPGGSSSSMGRRGYGGVPDWPSATTDARAERGGTAHSGAAAPEVRARRRMLWLLQQYGGAATPSADAVDTHATNQYWRSVDAAGRTRRIVWLQRQVQARVHAAANWRGSTWRAADDDGVPGGIHEA